jgi:hypothetical protein
VIPLAGTTASIIPLSQGMTATKNFREECLLHCAEAAVE